MSALQVSVGNSSTALVTDERNEFEFDLMGCLDEFRWHLIDVEMKDEDRRAIEGFFEGLLQEVEKITATKKRKKKILKAARKKMKKGFWKLYKKCTTRRGNALPKSPPSDPIRPLVVYTPMKKSRSDERENEMMAQAVDEEDIYYLRSDCDAYIAKSPSFFEKINGDDMPTHKRVPTLETVRIDSAWDPDLYESVNDDSFFDLETGIY